MRLLRYTAVVLGVSGLLIGAAWFWAMHTSSGARFLVSQAQPFGISVATVDGSVASELELGGLYFANDSVDVTVAALTAGIDLEFFPLRVTVETARANLVDVTVFASDDTDPAGASPGEVLGSLVLPLPITVSDLRATEITISADGQERQIDAVELEATWFERIDIRRLHVNAYDLAIAAAARLDPASGDVVANAVVDGVVTVDAQASVADEVTAEATLVVDRLELNGYVDNWPAGFPIDGSIYATIDPSRVQLSDSVLHIHGTDAQIDLGASFDRASEEIDASVRWAKLRWPLPADAARVHSDAGDLVLSGNVDDWTVAGEIEIEANGIPQGVFQIEGEGTRHTVAGRIVDSEVFGGRVAGDVSFGWLDPRPWTANLDVSDIDLEWLSPEWPAVVSGHINSYGTGDPFTMHAVLDGVDGELRGLPLQADGAIDLDAENFVADNLQILHGESRAALDGSIFSEAGLQLTATVADLATYAQGVAGPVEATGIVSLMDDAEGVDLGLRSPSLTFGEIEVNDIEAGITATPQMQLVRLDAVHRGTSFGIALEGMFDDWMRPWDSAFRGELDDFIIALDDEHSMALVEDAPLEFDRDGLELTDFCIADRTGSSMCADMHWQTSSGELGLGVELMDVPLALLEHVSVVPLQVDQRVSGNAEWRRAANGRSRGSGDLRLSAGRIVREGPRRVSVRTGPGVLQFVVEDGRLLSGELQLPLPGTGEVSGQFKVHDVTLLQDSGVEGRLDLDISNIAAITLLSANVDSAQGGLRANLNMRGTIANPKFAGEAALRDASFDYRPLGLVLSEVNLSAKVDENFQAEMTGTFKAGEGRGQLVSHADYGNADDPGLLFSLRGQNLTLVNVPDVQIAIDPDIDVTLERDTLTIDGSLVVPRARVKPTNLTVARINESEDVVIVAGELPDPPEEPDRQTDFRYEGNLKVELGQDVAVDLDVATARVSGVVAFEWLGDLVPIANGRYLVDGSVEALGQVLDINEGSVNFPQVPADKPYIRVRAEREIYGNTQVKRAGLLVDGPVSRPTVEAYTLPMTTEERAMALLVTGSDFDYEQGVGAIDFGTYIAPRLFISYGVGVFERENIISARFDLARGFGIKASSGSKESGIDLNYRFEN